MSFMETVFFAAAFLIPLVGGGSLLYFLSRDSKTKPTTSDSSETPPKKE